jgi:hypothetical protein
MVDESNEACEAALVAMHSRMRDIAKQYTMHFARALTSRLANVLRW